MPIEDIKNLVTLSEQLATAGQPSEEQVEDLARAGFEVIVNLGMAANTSWLSAMA